MTARLRNNPELAQAFAEYPDGGFILEDVTDRAGAVSPGAEHHLWVKPIESEELCSELLDVLNDPLLSTMRIRLVLAALVTLMDQNREVQVGCNALSNCIGADYISPRTVQRCIAWLVEAGRIENLSESTFGANRPANVYRVRSLNPVLS